MGSACCVASRDGTIQNESSSEILHRNIRYSPSWSFRWDNRGRVAEEETSVSWYTDGVGRNDGLENKSETVVETAHASEVGSPAENCQSLAWAKSPLSEGSAVQRRTPVADSSMPRNISMEVKGAAEFPTESDRSPVKLSPVMSSTPSLSTSPLSSQSRMFPASLTPSRLAHRSPKNPLLRQISDSRISGFKSPNNYIFEERPFPALPPCSNESTRVSHGGSSDGGFPEFTATSYRERWSFDSDSLGFNRDKITRSGSRISASPSIDLQTCRVCSKLLSEKSSFSSQKIVFTNDHSAVAVLICGHVYHAECLENMTPEISKYDPACPVCTLGEQQVLKMSEKILKAEMDSKARKRLRNRVVDGDFDSLDRRKGSGLEGKGPKMASSSSMKSSFGKPFFKRHFSFGSKGSNSFSESKSTRKKGFFWSKSTKE